MEFRVLGPFEVVSDGHAVPIGGNKERTLLARLLLSANQVVSSDTLTEDLWSGAPPEGAGQALWVYVSRLRKALRGDGDDLVVTRAPGYVLRVEPEGIDSCCFEALVERSRRSAASGNPEAAAAGFREALALWRGPALEGVADVSFARAEAARLEEARLAALEERIEADLACGRHGPLVGELGGLTREHPLRERLWAHRMLALYRAGRQAEALRAYQDVRRYLGEELGIEPGQELRQLETAMLRHDPAIDWSPGEQPDSPAAGVVSFLFTDVVGSTELLERVGDDTADELRRRHFAVLREALNAHGGTEVKSLGDGLMAAFASPLAAVRCAVAMQRAVAEDSRSGETALAVRVGLHAGEPIGEGDDYFGTPVVVAQRLCARARGAQILASALVQGLVANRDGCSFRPLGGLALKGFTDPVAACEVVWEEAPETVLPLPLPLERESSAFVARTAELHRLDAAWEDARAGRRQLVLVAGEPGIGKTRLTAEFVKRTHAGGGAAVLFGRCDEGMGVPYQPFVEALGLYLRQATTPTLGRLAGELVRLVPEIPQRVADLPPPIRSDPETERYRLFDAVAAWLSAVSAECPVVLVIDDLHWASRPTLSLLGHLFRSGEPLRLLIVATHRDTDSDVTADLTDALADLMREPGIDRIRLDGLDEAGVAAYLEARAHHELDDAARALAVTVHAGTAGNPFFVSQVIRHLAETEAIVRQQGRWTSETPVTALGIPAGVRDVIARRLGRLPAETGDLLGLASVIGDRFELDVLVRASGEPEVSTLRALDPAITARLITEVGDAAVEYRFVHALVRATLYDGLPRARRVEYHHRAAKAVEAAHANRLDDDLPALAHHYARAGQDERHAAVHYATLAGDRALAQQAHDEAVSWYGQALDLFTAAGIAADAQRCDLLISFGEAQRRTGDPAHRDTLLTAARLAQELRDAVRLARAALANTRGFSIGGEVDADRASTLEAALEALGDSESGLRARLLITLANEVEFSSDRERRHRLATEALAVARQLEDPEVLGHVLAIGYLPSLGLLDVHELEANVEQLGAVSEQVGDPALRWWAAVFKSSTALLVADLSAAHRHADAGARLAEELRQPFPHFGVAWQRASLATIAGDFDTAETLAGRAVEMAKAAGFPDAFRLYGTQLFWVRYDQGRLDEFLDVLTRAARREGVFPLTRVTLCLALCELDRLEEAAPYFRELAANGFSIPFGYQWRYAMALLSEVCARLGDLGAAAVLLDRLSPHHPLLAMFPGAAAGPVAHYLGLLATTLDRYDEADTYYQQAASTAERIGAPAWLARTRLEWARMLLTRNGPGDAERGRNLVTQALETAQKLGLGTIERRAVELFTPP